MSFEMHHETWSRGEKAAARRAFDKALERDYASLAEKVRRRANSIVEPGDIWKLHDFLTRVYTDKLSARSLPLLFEGVE